MLALVVSCPSNYFRATFQIPLRHQSAGPGCEGAGAGFFAFAVPDAIAGLAALLDIFFMIEKVCIRVLKEEFIVHRQK